MSGGDVAVYIPRLVEFHENLKGGIWLPRWAPDLSHGHGQPLFVFVPPLVQYLGEFWILLGVDAPVALRYVAVAAVVTASISMFLLGRLLFGNSGGLLASVGFVYAPYFAVDLFVRRALAEFVALAFFPAGLYGLVQYYRTRDRRKLLTTVVAYSAIVLTHNGAALLFTGTSLAFVVYLAWRSRSWRALAEPTLALGLALMLTAFFWLPSLTEMSAVHIERTINGYFDYRHHFVYPWQLLATTWGWGGSVIGDADNMSFSLGWSHVLCAIVAIVLYRRVSAEHRSAIFFFAVLTLTASYMTTQKSSSVFWSRIPLLPFLQFPWRFLCVAILGTALLAGALGAILETFARARAPLVLCALLLLTLPNLSHLKPQASLTGRQTSGHRRQSPGAEWKPLPWENMSPAGSSTLPHMKGRRSTCGRAPELSQCPRERLGSGLSRQTSKTAELPRFPSSIFPAGLQQLTVVKCQSRQPQLQG